MDRVPPSKEDDVCNTGNKELSVSIYGEVLIFTALIFEGRSECTIGFWKGLLHLCSNTKTRCFSCEGIESAETCVGKRDSPIERCVAVCESNDRPESRSGESAK